MKEEFTEELVRRAKDGDMAAKGKLCQQFKDSIYRMAHTTYKTLDAAGNEISLAACSWEHLRRGGEWDWGVRGWQRHFDRRSGVEKSFCRMGLVAGDWGTPFPTVILIASGGFR